MRAFWRRFKNGYLNLSLQTKCTIALISIVVIPAFLTVFLFYGRLYNMVVSNTIRQEQDASAKTAPLIERTMDTILATTRNITGQNFFQELFYMPVSDSSEKLATSNHAIDFKNAVQRLTTDSIVTDVRIYVDFPDDLKSLNAYPNTEDLLAPLSQAKGTYWYGIFQGNREPQEMFCPSFYLGSQEKQNYGDMAFRFPGTGAIFYSDRHFHFRQQFCSFCAILYLIHSDLHQITLTIFSFSSASTISARFPGTREPTSP